MSKKISDTAMLLAAGLGTRMRPLSLNTPKPLLKAAGKALLDYNLDALKGANIQRAIINLHYLPEQMIAHCNAIEGLDILFTDETKGLLDSGGGIKQALQYFGGESFFCLNADTIWLDGPFSNLMRMRDIWNPDQMDILLLVANTCHTIGWGNRGDFFMDQAGRLARPERQQNAPFAYTGAAIFKPALFEIRPEKFSLNLLFDEAIASNRLFGLRLDGVFMHVGTPDALSDSERALTGK